MPAKQSQTNETHPGTRRRKRPNAEKFGIFSKDIAILPGEEEAEFYNLLSAYMLEWKPDGPSEREAVLTLAKVEWYKRRLQKFLIAEMMRNLITPGHPSFDQNYGVVTFLNFVSQEPEKRFESFAGRFFTKDVVKYFSLKCPAAKFGSNSQRLEAIAKEIMADDLLRPDNWAEVPDAADWSALIRSAATLTLEKFEQHLASEEPASMPCRIEQ